jgi:GNAT superfamily N-acetyltransferase
MALSEWATLLNPSEARGAKSYRIRPAAAGDFAAVATLLAELGRPTLTAGTEGTAKAVYLRHLTRKDTASLVAEWDGRVVGFLSLEFRDRLNKVRPQAWIPDLIVTESYRKRGIAQALLDSAFARAREHGCWGVTLESGYHRKDAHRLYLRVGMDDAGKYFNYLL